MYLQRAAAISLRSLACTNALSLRSRIATNMPLPSKPPAFQQRQPQLSDEEILFTGRCRTRNLKRKERMAYRREHPEYVPGSGRPDLYPPAPGPASRVPPPQVGRSGAGNGTYRDGGDRGLPPRPKTPEAWGSGYRADSRGGRHRDTDRESQSRYESSGRRNESYAAPIYDSMGYRNAETTRNTQSGFYNHANFSGNGGVALHSQFDGNTSRGDQYGSHYYNQPPGGTHASSSYSSAPGAYQPYERSQVPGLHSQRLPQRSEHDNYRSGHHGSPNSHLSSRGPLSSFRFSQSINKHSRYAELNAPTAAFSTSAAKPSAGADSRRTRKTIRQAANREVTPLHTNRTVSPPPPPVPFPKNALPVPKPSQDYLSLSLIPSPRLASPARQLVILDLNGTLLARGKGRAHSGSLNPTPRPGLGLFLRYLFAQFNVMVWSSAQPDNVRMMVRALFSPLQKAALLALWGRDTLGLTKQQFSMKTQVYKRLERVWDGEYKIPHSEQGCAWDQTNTMLLDDSALKAKGQPWNHVEVPEFLGAAIELKQDRALYAVVGYLDEARWNGNVSAFIKAVPFKVGGRWDTAGAKVLSEYGAVEWKGGIVGQTVEGGVERF